MFGPDVASVRIDDLDRACITYALTITDGHKRVLDIGSGKSRLAVILALMNFNVTAYDREDYFRYFKQTKLVTFVQKDMRDIVHSDIEKGVEIIIAQRVLHHIPFIDAQKVLTVLSSKLVSGGEMFISLSGLESELGNGYVDANKEVTQRYVKISEDNQNKFSMSDKVCLYTKGDVEKLLEPLPITIEKIWQSKFGNIKVIARRD